MKCCAAFLLLDAVTLGAYGSLKVSDQPGEVGGWAFQDKNVHHEPSVAQPKSNPVQRPDWLPPAAKVAKVAAKGVSSGHSHLKGTNGVVKKMHGAVSKMKVHASGDLMGTLVGDCRKNLQLDEFLPKCMAHLDDLIADIDYDYSDAQLEITLRNFCSHAQEFPKSHGDADGFLKEVSCVEFAEDLYQARVLELKTQKTSGYKDFCTKFYEHHGGRMKKPKAKKEEEPWKGSASTPSMVSVGIILSFALARVL